MKKWNENEINYVPRCNHASVLPVVHRWNILGGSIRLEELIGGKGGRPHDLDFSHRHDQQKYAQLDGPPYALILTWVILTLHI